MARFTLLLGHGTPQAPTSSEVADAYVRLLGDEAEAPVPEAVGEDGQALVLHVGGVPVSVAFQTTQIPPEQWEECAEQAVYWPQAAEDMRDHRHHVVLSASAPDGDRAAALAAARAVTLVAAAIAGKLETIGALWQTSGGLVEGKALIMMADALVDGHFPDRLWIAIATLAAPGVLTPVLATRGLTPFIGREVEFSLSDAIGREAVDGLSELARQLIRHGPVFADGEGFNLPGAGRVVAHHLAEGVRAGIPVMRFEAVAGQSAQPAAATVSADESAVRQMPGRPAFGRRGLVRDEP